MRAYNHECMLCETGKFAYHMGAYSHATSNRSHARTYLYIFRMSHAIKCYASTSGVQLKKMTTDPFGVGRRSTLASQVSQPSAKLCDLTQSHHSLTYIPRRRPYRLSRTLTHSLSLIQSIIHSPSQTMHLIGSLQLSNSIETLSDRTIASVLFLILAPSL